MGFMLALSMGWSTAGENIAELHRLRLSIGADLPVWVPCQLPTMYDLEHIVWW